jgi:DNA-binding transcriptional LysR family regulator
LHERADTPHCAAMARPLIDVKDLEFFLAAYEARGFSKAAKSLGTVQSNVSVRIALLERRLRSQLFDRLHRELRPTLAGAKLYAASASVLASLRSLEKALLGKKAGK